MKRRNVKNSSIILHLMRALSDSYRHKGLRKQLVELIRNKGISDERVLQAIQEIPRHYFIDSAFDQKAYEDRAFPIAEGQTISQPYTVAYQTQLLDIQPHEKVLEVGTGSGYQACVLAMMGAQVYTIERQKQLYDQNKQFSYLRNYPSIRYFYGDGYQGLPTYAPFDKIIVTAAAPVIPDKLVEQLRNGGKMVIPVGEGKVQQMMRIYKDASGQIHEEIYDDFSFVPMLQGKNN
ncbi:MAG TPA: protein-L-isoaspartate(D-aspartate) O-methyltransferase [Puia sp.]|jgi:protein-L-isoaspartate(D-aspartate) O-methyltransferase|nr:protein-L-isoaspartate(D-aspartate) O-methyltransferase [Puia sp.]